MPSILWRIFTYYLIAVGIEWFFVERLDTFGLGDALHTARWTGYAIFFIGPVIPVALYIVYRHHLRPTLRTIRVCQFHRCIQYMPIYVADAKGYFRNNGIKLVLSEVYGDDKAWSAVKTGQAEFGVADPTIMVNDAECNGKVVAAIVGKVSWDGVSRKSLAAITNIRGLANKTIAVYESPSTSFKLAKKIEQTLIATNESLLIKEMTPGTEFGVLKSPNIDIVAVAEPIATAAEDEGAHRIFSGSKLFPPCLITGLFGSATYIHENPALVQAVVDSLQQSLTFIHKNPLGALRIAARYFPDSKNYATERAFLRVLSEGVIPRKCTVLEPAWENCLELRVGEDSPKFPFSRFVDNTFAAAAATSYADELR